ncbi:MAG: hypothetical protein V4498_06195, partial [candidate division FCPU426 bacterium]
MRTFILLVLATLVPASGVFGGEASLLYSSSTLVYPEFWHTPLGVHRATPALLRIFLGDKADFQ